VTTQPGKTQEELSPRSLMRILGDFANSQILVAALEYDFFTLIHRGSQTTDEVAREAGTRPRATRIVLDGLIALALIEKKDGRQCVAKKLNRECGLEGKIRFIDGEHRSATIETSYYDLILTCNFCRFESPKGNQELFQKAYGALRPGGSLVINDFLANGGAHRTHLCLTLFCLHANAYARR
jgi:SAM-dependent methyltransferase